MSSELDSLEPVTAIENSQDSGTSSYISIICVILCILALVGLIIFLALKKPENCNCATPPSCPTPETCPKATVCPEQKVCAVCPEQNVCAVCPEQKVCAVQESNTAIIPVANYNFTDPVYTPGQWAYNVNINQTITLNGWNYKTDGFSKFGIGNGNTPFTGVAMPNNYTQYLFAQLLAAGTGSVSQQFQFSSGTYILQLYCVGRGSGWYNAANTMNVAIGSNTIVTNYSPSITQWNVINAPFTITTAGQQSLNLIFTNTSSADSTICVTGVKIIKIA